MNNAELVIKLRQLAALMKGGPQPDWVPIVGAAPVIADVCEKAADALDVKVASKFITRDKVQEALDAANRELQDYRGSAR